MGKEVVVPENMSSSQKVAPSVSIDCYFDAETTVKHASSQKTSFVVFDGDFPYDARIDIDLYPGEVIDFIASARGGEGVESVELIKQVVYVDAAGHVSFGSGTATAHSTGLTLDGGAWPPPGLSHFQYDPSETFAIQKQKKRTQFLPPPLKPGSSVTVVCSTLMTQGKISFPRELNAIGRHAQGIRAIKKMQIVVFARTSDFNGLKSESRKVVIRKEYP